MAWHGMAWNDVAWHGMSMSMARHGIARADLRVDGAVQLKVEEARRTSAPYVEVSVPFFVYVYNLNIN